MKKNNDIFEKTSKNDIKPDHYYQNIELINDKFNKEYLKYSHYIKINNDKALTMINNISEMISYVKFDNITVELTPSNAIKFKIKVGNDKMFIIDCPFALYKGMQSGDVFYSLWINGENIITDMVNISILLEGIKKYISE